MKRHYIKIAAFLSFSFLLKACFEPSEGKVLSLEKKETINFRLEMSADEKYVGSFFTPEKEIQFYFANTITEKVIKYFDLKGNLVGETNLEPILQLEHGIDAIEVLAQDSIFVLSQYTANVYLIGVDGIIKSKTNLPQFIEADLSFELYGSTMGKFISGKHAITGVVWTPELDQNNFKEEIEYALARAKVFYNNPTIYKLPLGQEDKGEPKAFNLFRALPPDTSSFYGELFNCTIAGNKVLYWSWYSDTLLSLNANTFQLIDKHNIKSSFTSTKVMPIRYEEFLKDMSRVNESFKTQGNINSVSFNTEESHYYVLVNVRTSREKIDEQGFRSWALLIYDESFQLIGEQLFAKNQYKQHLIPYRKGFLLEKKLPEVAYDQITAEFDYYEY